MVGIFSEFYNFINMALEDVTDFEILYEWRIAKLGNI
jgi:hypothetical protein